MNNKCILIVLNIDYNKILKQRPSHLIEFCKKKFKSVTVVYVTNDIEFKIDYLENKRFDNISITHEENVEFVALPQSSIYEIKQRIIVDGEIIKKYLINKLANKMYDFCLFCHPFSAPIVYSIKEYNIANKIIYEDLDDFYDFYEHMTCEDKQIVKISEQYILSNCDAIFSVSKRLKNYRIEQSIQNNIYVSNNGVYLNKFLRYKDSIRHKDIVFIGSIEEWAGIQRAIKGVEECINNGLKVKFDIYGEGSYEVELRKLVSSLELNEFIKFNGRIEHDRLPALLSEYKIGVITFAESNLTKFAHPIKIFEYFASGLPIIGSGFGEINDVINESQAGITIKDEKEFYLSLKNIINSKEALRKFRLNAYNYVKDFDWNNIFLNEFIIADKCMPKDNICKLDLGEEDIVDKILNTNDKEFSIYKVMNKLESESYNKGKKRVAIFGAGDHTKVLLKHIKFEKLELIGLIDNNSSLWGGTKFNLKVMSFDESISNSLDIIIISSRAFENEIYNSIINECDKNNINVYRLYYENEKYEALIWKQLYLEGGR